MTTCSAKSCATTSAPVNVRGETIRYGSSFAPRSASSPPTPVFGPGAASTSRRPPARIQPARRAVSTRENGSRAPATTSTAQSSGTAGVAARSSVPRR